MEPNQVLSGLTRLLHIASFMDKDRKIALMCNSWTLQYLILAKTEYKPIDFWNCAVNGTHIFTAQYLPRYTLGVAFYETCQTMTQMLPNWHLSKFPYIQMLDRELSSPGFRFIDNVLYLSIADDQKVTQSWPTQMEFIQNSPINITSMRLKTDSMVSV